MSIGVTPGLKGLSEIMVQNISGRIILNHTDDTLSCLWQLSSESDKLKREMSIFEDDDPRCVELRLKQAHMLNTYRMCRT